MLKTIRIPKNLLYLTDRLPKPQYDEGMNKKPHAQSVIIKSNKKESVERDGPQSDLRAPRKVISNL